MKKTYFIILCLIIFISGCTKSPELPKNYEANSVEWHDNDFLVYHAKDGLYAYQTSNGTTKKLLSEELSGFNWNIIDFNSKYYGSSLDGSKYILSTGKRHILQIYEANTDKIIKTITLNDPNDEIYEAGWFDNENIFLATRFTLYLANVISGEQVRITEDSFDLISQLDKSIGDYIWWVKDVYKIGDQLYYNGVRSFTDQISSTIYYNDKLNEQKLLEKAILLKVVDDQRFIYLKQSDNGYEGTFLYNIQTGESFLIAKEDLRNTGGIFLTNDSKLAFVTMSTDSTPYFGVIFDPVTLQAEIFEMFKNSSNIVKTNLFGQFMGAFENNGGYVFLIGGYQYNSKTNKLTQVEGYESKKGINMQISPSGKYIVIDDNNLFDVIRSDNL
ncbi:hypothetical protein LPY66_13590 [Dehalobacter sp. DCM]|uniref:hypothetical protein n=1 Tax=Dehalobacter sp. DCM TaxID=2907827 RepID=UPI0030815670|nr:hypothetical protein LPY66_13590 [Dehalobacter sp. DCM]